MTVGTAQIRADLARRRAEEADREIEIEGDSDE